MPFLALFAVLAAPVLYQGTMQKDGAAAEPCALVVRTEGEVVQALLVPAGAAPQLFRGFARKGWRELKGVSDGTALLSGEETDAGFAGSFEAPPDRFELALHKAFAPAAPARGWAGLLGGATAVRLQLARSGAALSGRLLYAKGDGELSVRGPLDPSGAFELEERDGRELTGRLFGFLGEERAAGVWSRPDGKKERVFDLYPALPLPPIATLPSREQIAPRFAFSNLGSCTADAVWPELRGMLLEQVRRSLDFALRSAAPQPSCATEDDPPASATYQVTATARWAAALEFRETAELRQRTKTRCVVVDLTLGDLLEVRELDKSAGQLDALAFARLPSPVRARLEEVFGGRGEKVTAATLCVVPGRLIARFVEDQPPVYREHDATLTAAEARKMLRYRIAVDSLLGR